MKRLYPTVVLTGMLTLALGLSACSTLRGEGGSASGASGASGSTSSGSGDRAADGPPPGSGSASTGTIGNPSAALQSSGANAYDSGAQPGMPADQAGAVGASGAAGSSASGQDQLPQRAAPPPSASTTPNSTVISIEPLASSSGSSGSGTSRSSGASSEQAYRITLRMDDGSTQVVSQSSTPTYRSGDRVNLNSGVISR